MIPWFLCSQLQPDNWICQLPWHVRGEGWLARDREHGLYFREKNRLICSGVSSGFLTASAFQFNKMFQENVILEPVSSAPGRRGHLITLRWPKQKQLSRVSASQQQGSVGGPRALPKGKGWEEREGSGPGLSHNRRYWKGPGPSHGQRAREASSQAWLGFVSDSPEIFIGLALCCFAVSIPPSLLPLLITLSPNWKGFIV